MYIFKMEYLSDCKTITIRKGEISLYNDELNPVANISYSTPEELQDILLRCASLKTVVFHKYDRLLPKLPDTLEHFIYYDWNLISECEISGLPDSLHSLALVACQSHNLNLPSNINLPPNLKVLNINSANIKLPEFLPSGLKIIANTSYQPQYYFSILRSYGVIEITRTAYSNVIEHCSKNKHNIELKNRCLLDFL
jgi:hypothetical protein